MVDFDVFVSYSGRDRSHRLEKFLDDLRDRTHLKIFQDVRSIQSGHSWDGVILSALTTCPMGLVLVSNHYLASKFCGREFQVLFERRNATSPSELGALLPIYWSVPTVPLPPRLKRLQLNDSMLSESYRSGFCYLIEHDAAAYEKNLEALCARLTRPGGALRVQGSPRPFDLIPDAFAWTFEIPGVVIVVLLGTLNAFVGVLNTYLTLLPTKFSISLIGQTIQLIEVSTLAASGAIVAGTVVAFNWSTFWSKRMLFTCLILCATVLAHNVFLWSCPFFVSLLSLAGAFVLLGIMLGSIEITAITRRRAP